MQKIVLYNSLSRKKEEFIPLKSGEVKMYACGFTVYDHTHLGHIKRYLGDDIIRRIFEFNGYKVIHVQNVTDVGHLVSDSDDGMDKMEKGAVKHNLSVWEVAKLFEQEFYSTLDSIGVLRPTTIENASSDKSISEQLINIKKLIDSEYAYITKNAVYFDVSKLPEYNPFSSQKLEDKITGAREDIVSDPNKKHPADFALWVFTIGEHANHVMRWNSPWGDGFPGWHIECSTISMSNLGDHFDIHTGGLDHQYIHHPNEIAQNYGLTGHKVVNYWMHHNFLVVDGKKMSKSLDNFYTLKDIMGKKYNPYALRYLLLGSHYRQQMNFTWDSMQSAQITYDQLLKKVLQLLESVTLRIELDPTEPYYVKFLDSINDDFNVPKTLGLLWEMIKDPDVTDSVKLANILEFDKVLGLNLEEQVRSIKNDRVDIRELPQNIIDLINQREFARKNKNWEQSDKIRQDILEQGYKIEDLPNGYEISQL